MTDDPGVMGNLPRSRPGRRSSKRDTTRGGAKSAQQTTEVTPASSAKAKPAAGKSAAGRPTAKKATPKTTKRRTTAKGSTSTRARAGAARRPPSDQPTRQEPATRGSTDPVTGAVILAGKVVEGGMKVAGGILKRLPRP